MDINAKGYPETPYSPWQQPWKRGDYRSHPFPGLSKLIHIEFLCRDLFALSALTLLWRHQLNHYSFLTVTSLVSERTGDERLVITII
jgi:hypothetical protein